MIKKTNYKVYKTTPKSTQLVKCQSSCEDEYGSTIYHDYTEWQPFSSELYWIKDEEYNRRGSLYWSPNCFYPVAPSGNYNHHYANMGKKNLKDLEHVGNFDGEKFDFDVPYLYTSIFELDILDVFTLKGKYTHSGLFSEKEIIVNSEEKLVLEDFSKFNLNNVSVSRLDKPSEIFTIYGDRRVNKIGRIRIERVIEEI